jgi:hypothetical protein
MFRNARVLPCLDALATIRTPPPAGMGCSTTTSSETLTPMRYRLSLNVCARLETCPWTGRQAGVGEVTTLVSLGRNVRPSAAEVMGTHGPHRRGPT